MKKKTGVWMLVLLVLAVPALLAGCTVAPAVPAHDPSEATAADVARELERYISQSIQSEPRSDSAGAAIEAAILDNVTYTVADVSRRRAKLTVTAPDMSALVDEMIAMGSSQEKGQSFLMEALQNGDFETVTTTITVEVDENGLPVDSYVLADAMYGGLLSKYEELLGEAGAAK